MSVVAISPGYHDATDMIQSAIDDAGAGGTVKFAAGDYHVSRTLDLQPGRTLQGAGNATLNWDGGGGGDVYLGESQQQGGVTVSGLGIAGAGLKLGDRATASSTTGSTTWTAAPSTSSAAFPTASSAITRLTLSAATPRSSAGMPQNSHFDNNTFDSVHEGIHCFWGGTRDGDDNVSIQHNVFEHVRHFGRAAGQSSRSGHRLQLGGQLGAGHQPDGLLHRHRGELTITRRRPPGTHRWA